MKCIKALFSVFLFFCGVAHYKVNDRLARDPWRNSPEVKAIVSHWESSNKCSDVAICSFLIIYLYSKAAAAKLRAEIYCEHVNTHIPWE